MKLKCEMKQLSNEDKKNRKLSVDVQLSAPTVVTDYQFNTAYGFLYDDDEARIELVMMKAVSDAMRGLDIKSPTKRKGSNKKR